MAPIKYRYRLLFAFVSAFVINAFLYLLSLSTAGFILGTSRLNVAFPLFVCMVCSVLGLAVLRKFGCSWNWGLVAAYGAIGFFLLLLLTLVASVIGGHGAALRTEVVVGIALLQGVAFVLPAILWGKRILADREALKSGRS